jgi:hypothetical protein
LLRLTRLRLARLWLSNTKVSGDVKGLAPLTQLTSLSLYTTKVAGEAAALAPLRRLTRLLLEGTAVAGCGAFCGDGGPVHTACEPTHEAGCR